MTTLIEGNLRISFPESAVVRKFDDPQTHELSHCMKAVDFIVEESQRILFIEIKDPENPQSKEKESKKFLEKFLSGGLDQDLKYKFRDSLIYEWASNKIKKPVFYLVLIAIENLKEPEILNYTDRLKRQLPLDGPRSWNKRIVDGCTIFNVRTWNKNMPDYPIERI